MYAQTIFALELCNVQMLIWGETRMGVFFKKKIKFITHKPEKPVRGIKLQEKEVQKD